MVSIKFIWHDCFLIQTPHMAAVFDYWKESDDGEPRPVGEFPTFLDSIPSGLPLYVFVSHHHKDHFVRSVFSWEKLHPDIRFIISNDTRKAVRFMLREDGTYAGFRPTLSKVTVLSPGEEYSDEIMGVKAFPSTDIGNSYLLRLDSGMTLFHAGDLNAWIWKDESTEDEVAAATKAFSDILEKIASEAPVIDVAMFPVDSRIGSEWWRGAAMFVRRIDVGRFIPMHFCLADTLEERNKRFADAVRFDLYANRSRGEYISLQKPGATLCIGEKSIHVWPFDAE